MIYTTALFYVKLAKMKPGVRSGAKNFFFVKFKENSFSQPLSTPSKYIQKYVICIGPQYYRKYPVKTE